MKILLLLPPYPKDKIFRKSMKSVGAVLPPLGLAYIASLFEKNGYDVKIIDGPSLANVKNYGFEELEKDLKAFSPDVIGISASFSQMDYAKKSLNLIKNILPTCVNI